MKCKFCQVETKQGDRCEKCSICTECGKYAERGQKCLKCRQREHQHNRQLIEREECRICFKPAERGKVCNACQKKLNRFKILAETKAKMRRFNMKETGSEGTDRDSRLF